MKFRKQYNSALSGYLRVCHTGRKFTETTESVVSQWHDSCCIIDGDTAFASSVLKRLFQIFNTIYLANRFKICLFVKYFKLSYPHDSLTALLPKQMISDRFLNELYESCLELECATGSKNRRLRLAWLKQLLRPLKTSHGLRCRPVSGFYFACESVIHGQTPKQRLFT
jgi:hypothetical protein